MKFGWETEEERLLRHMRLPPKKKLEWLREINEFIAKYSPENAKQIRSQITRSNGKEPIAELKRSGIIIKRRV